MLQLRSRGLPRVNGGGIGDLHVRVQLWTPDSVTREEEQLLRKLAETQKPPQSREKGFWTRMKEALGA
jgi:molecular chaperone DnaJ